MIFECRHEYVFMFPLVHVCVFLRYTALQSAWLLLTYIDPVMTPDDSDEIPSVLDLSSDMSGGSQTLPLLQPLPPRDADAIGRGGSGSLYAGLDSILFTPDGAPNALGGNNICYLVNNTAHTWDAASLMVSFATGGDVDSYQVLWFEFPLVLSIASSELRVVVYPNPDSTSENSLPLLMTHLLLADTFYAVSLTMNDTVAALNVNGVKTSFGFEAVNPAAVLDNQEKPSGPYNFVDHTGRSG